MGDSDETSPPLKYGDYITLRGGPTGFLFAEGTMDDDMCLQTNVKRFDNCIFQIRIQNQYSAARELSEFDTDVELALATDEGAAPLPVTDNKTTTDTIRDTFNDEAEEDEEEDLDPAAKFRMALERGKENEQTLNESYFEQKKGVGVCYGDNIQLMHVNSGKFLTVNVSEVATVERANLRVLVDEDGSNLSWLNVEPRFKIDRLGDPVLSDAQVFLRVASRTSEYIRASDSEGEGALEREINCSLDRTAWNLVLYDSLETEGTKKLLHAGDIIYLADPESDSQLRLLQPSEGEALREGEAISPADVFLDPVSEKGEIDSNAMFLIECEDASIGGKLVWRDETYRLRHLNTGRYLCTRKMDTPKTTPRGSSQDVFCFSSHDNQHFDGVSETQCVSTVFKLQPLYQQEVRSGDDRYVPNSTAVQLVDAFGNFMVRGDSQKIDGSTLIRIPALPEKSAAVSLLVVRLPREMVRDSLVGLSALLRLQGFKEDLLRMAFSTVRRKMYHIEEVVTKLIAFTNDISLSTPYKEIHQLDKSGSLKQNKERQKLLKEEGVLISILETLEILANANQGPSRPVSRPGGDQGAPLEEASGNQEPDPQSYGSVRGENGEVVLTLPRDILAELRKCLCPAGFRLLYFCLHGSSPIQMHVASKLYVFINYVGKEPGATRCIVEMLGTNRELQESRVGRREVATFVNMIRGSPMNSTLLSLLKSVCSCMGNGVDNNQGAVVSLLLDSAPELLIQVGVDTTGGRLPWKIEQKPIYQGADPKTVAGGLLKAEGLPTVVLCWQSSKEELSPHALFGKSSVSVVELCTKPAMPEKQSTMLKQQLASLEEAARKRKMIADYFTAQVNLAAEMCLDRNYNSIESLYKTFGGECGDAVRQFGPELEAPANQVMAYEVLVSMVATESLPPYLRASVVSLLVFMYVDCAPQTRMRVPRLTRSWDDVPSPGAATTVVALPCVAVDRRNFFSLLQDIISDHLHQLNGSCGNELTSATVKLLLWLMEFRFYSTTAQIQDVVEPLAASIDRRGKDSGKKDRASSFSEAKSATLTPTKSFTKVYPLEAEEAKEEAEPVEETVDDRKKSMRGQVLTFLESRLMLILVLVLVFASVGTALYAQLTARDKELGFLLFDYFGTAVFAIELFTRLSCYMYVFKEFWSFWKDAFNILDGVVVGMDFAFIALDILTAIGSSSSGGSDQVSGFTKGLRSLRVIRFLRMMRVVRAARVVRRLRDTFLIQKAEYQLPERYGKTAASQLTTMVSMVEVITYTNKLWRDHNLSKVLECFKKWATGDSPEEPPELFEEAIEKGKILNYGKGSELDLVLLDLCMYEDPVLVQRSLTCLMDMHSMKSHLLRDIKDIQLLTVEKDMHYKDELEQHVLIVRQLAETFELWDGLESPEDLAKLEEMKDKLNLLTLSCRKYHEKLDFGNLYRPNFHMQNMLTNLGAFEAMTTILGLAAELEDEGEEAEDEDEDDGSAGGQEVKQQAVLDILTLTCKFLCAWVFQNPHNQAIAHKEIKTFMDLADQAGDVGAVRIIAEVFRDNLELMPLFNNQLIVDFVSSMKHSMIVPSSAEPQEEGTARFPSPELLVVFNAITASGHRGILANQYGVMKEFTRTETVQSGLLFLSCTPDSELYQYRKDLCALAEKQSNPDVEDPDEEHLPPDLVFHTALLEMLAKCAVGRVSITIIEVKLQTLYPYEDQLFALLDPDLSLVVKVPLANYLYQACIDVQITVPNLAEHPLLWRWLKQFPRVFRSAHDVLSTLSRSEKKNGRIVVTMAQRRQIRYAFICVDVVQSVFSREGAGVVSGRKLVDPDSPAAIAAIRRQAALDPKRNVLLGGAPNEVELDKPAFNPNMMSPDETAEGNEEEVDEFAWLDDLVMETYNGCSGLYEENKRNRATNTSVLNLKMHRELETCLMVLGLTSAKMQAHHAKMQGGASKTVEEDDQSLNFEDEIAGKLKRFSTMVSTDEDLLQKIKNDRMEVMAIMESLPREADDSEDVELQFEPLIRKLVRHTRSQLTLAAEGKKKLLSEECTESAIWMIQLFRNMIEEKWGMNIDDRDDEGGEEEDEKGGPTQSMLNEAGATSLCLDLIAPGIDEALVLECVKCLIALLFKEGGHGETQETINTHLSGGHSELFFLLCRQWITRMTEWHKVMEDEIKQGGFLSENENGEDYVHEIPEMSILLRFLQLCSEGHFLPNQEIVREQPNNATNVNLLNDMVEHIQVLSKFQCQLNTQAGKAMTDLILEVIQGPCFENQSHFALRTELIETLNRMLRARVVRDCIEEEEDELKETVLSIFQGLLEGQGQGEGSNVYERVLAVLHFDVLHMMAVGGDGDPKPPGTPMSTAQTESLVLMQMLFNYRPSLKDVLGPGKTQEMDDLLGIDENGQRKSNYKPTVCSVEVVWNGVLQRRFFHVPTICHDLSDASKAQFVEEVDRSSQESKLAEFMESAKDLHLEILHQQQLKLLNIAHVFSRQNQNNATWMGFSLACIINLIMAIFYKSGSCGDGESEGELTAYKYGDVDGVIDAAKYGCNVTACKFAEDPTISPWIQADYASQCLDSCAKGDCVYMDDAIQTTVMVINVFQIIFSAFVLILFLVVRVPMLYQSLRAKDCSRLSAGMFAMFDPLTVYYLWYQVFAVMALLKANWYSAFLLLDIIVKDGTTRAVVRAVYVPRKQLSMTLILGLFIIYIFAIFNFFYYRDKFSASGSYEDCTTLMDCFKTTLGYGLRNGGGIGDIMTHTLGERFWFDILFFFVVLIVMLNVIFGIIIDTFSELRSQKVERLEDTLEKCFICGIEKAEFDKQSDSRLSGFTDHYKNDHNMWSYFYFIVYIKEQDKDDDDGLEQYVRRNLDMGDISWFPIGRAMTLTLEEEEEDLPGKVDTLGEELRALKSDLELSFRTMSDQLTKMQDKIKA
eukprot:gene5494-6657_t